METSIAQDNKRLKSIYNISKKVLLLIISNLLILSIIFAIAIAISIATEIKLSLDKSSYESGLYDIDGGFDLIPEHVMAYSPLVEKYMVIHDVPIQYLPFLLAQISQESYGKGPDIFQASESKYNGKVGLIKSEEESIEHAIFRWRQIIDKIESKNLEVTIPLILQTYNFGDGYLNYVEKNGGAYSKETAITFSKIQSKKLGWKSYGDTKYVEHVLRYVSDTGDTNFNPIGSDKFNQLFAKAKTFLGTPYVYGGNGYSGIDCSAFTQHSYKTIGVNLPRTAQSQYDLVTKNGTETIKKMKDLQPGDLVFFTRTYNAGRYITHVGIYVGNGKMIHAGDPVSYTNLNSNYWKSHFVAGGRIN